MKSYRKLVVPTIYVGVVACLAFCTYMIITGISKYVDTNINYKYTLDILEDSEEVNGEVNEEVNNQIQLPYLSDEITIYRNFYDKNSEKELQEKSIVYYENTYIQNSGIDYVSDNDFDVMSVYDGEVINIEDSTLYGKTLTIKHNDNLITVYSSLKDILVNIGYKTTAGEIIASSNASSLNDNKSTLHFETYYKNEVINPNDIYNQSINNYN